MVLVPDSESGGLEGDLDKSWAKCHIRCAGLCGCWCIRPHGPAVGIGGPCLRSPRQVVAPSCLQWVLCEGCQAGLRTCQGLWQYVSLTRPGNLVLILPWLSFFLSFLKKLSSYSFFTQSMNFAFCPFTSLLCSFLPFSSLCVRPN